MVTEIEVIFLCTESVSDQNLPNKMFCEWEVYHLVIRPGEDMPCPKVLMLPPSMTFDVLETMGIPPYRPGPEKT